jgi:hypothetical protein
MAVLWREIDSNLSQWTLAGRRDTPPSSRAGAVAAFVQFASTYSNQQSMNLRIQTELRQVSSEVDRRLSRAPEWHGVFAVVSMVESRHADGQRSLSDGRVTVHPGTYADRDAAMRRMTATGTLRAESRRPASRMLYRYFWGTRPVQRPPRYIGGSMRSPGARFGRRRGPLGEIKPPLER